tara:strand:+ start:101 stop:862 length:762 start_codon:yes stop_codon:yes gene_type:complete
MKILGVIPAHMASVRLPNKVLIDILGIPMIEHVRRRALLSEKLDDVIVATCDLEIANVIKSYNGSIIMTSNTHKNGTSRVAEAVEDSDYSHILLLQGDEPLLLPRHINSMAKAINSNPNIKSWNATGDISYKYELEKNSFVKCSVLKNNKILNCFRKTPYLSELEVQKKFVRKILGIIAYRKDFLLKLNQLPETPIELAEFIEQMRVIENGYDLYSVPVEPSLASVNESHEIEIILNYLKNDAEQKALLEKIL